LGFALLALIAASACRRQADEGIAASGSLRGANVLLVTIDTLRQDRVGAYGNANGLTPTLDRLASSGVRFAHAFTPAPLTLPAHASILTGLLPRRHGIHNNTSFRLDLAVVYAGLGRADEARTVFHQLLDRNPAAATTWFNLGLFELQTRRLSEAVAAFRRATAIEPSYGEAWQALGAALLNSNRPEAIDAWRTAERILPRDYDLLFNLAMVLADSDMPAEAIPYLQRFAREAPSERYARNIARVRATLARLERRQP